MRSTRAVEVASNIANRGETFISVEDHATMPDQVVKGEEVWRFKWLWDVFNNWNYSCW